MIRPATPADAGALHAIWTPVIRETTSIFHTTERSEEEIAALTQGSDPFLVWDDGGTTRISYRAPADAVPASEREDLAAVLARMTDGLEQVVGEAV